jgi:hypothetical protein
VKHDGLDEICYDPAVIIARRWGLLAFALTACGPVVDIADGSADGSGTGQGSVSGESEGASATEAVDGTGTTASTDGSTGEPPATSWCLYGTPLPELPGPNAMLLAVYDADGDGRDEVWMGEQVSEPMDPGSRISVYELGDGPALAPIYEVVRYGSVQAMADIDGDGLRDFIMSQTRDPSQWWLAGLPGVSVDAFSQPLDAPTLDGAWIDADGDGATDLFETITTALVLYMGDGDGGFIQADTLDFGFELGSARAWPSGIPGRLLVDSSEQSFGLVPTVLWGVEVSPAGEITVLASGGIGTVAVRHVDDLDGDMVPDALGFNEASNQGLSYAFQDTPESYGVETTEISIFGMVAGSFVTTDDVDLLHWDNEEPEVSLRPREEDGDWPTVLPVTVVGPWLYAGDFHTLQADGEGSLEILHRSAQGDDSVYDLWSLEPCR